MDIGQRELAAHLGTDEACSTATLGNLNKKLLVHLGDQKPSVVQVRDVGSNPGPQSFWVRSLLLEKLDFPRSQSTTLVQILELEMILLVSGEKQGH